MYICRQAAPCMILTCTLKSMHSLVWSVVQLGLSIYHNACPISVAFWKSAVHGNLEPVLTSWHSPIMTQGYVAGPIGTGRGLVCLFVHCFSDS